MMWFVVEEGDGTDARDGNRPTLGDSVASIGTALQDYIEATYHIGHPSLVAQRRELLEEEGVLFRAPYIESTPRYTAGTAFADLDIPAAAKALFAEMTRPAAGEEPLLHDPPYTHQAGAVEATTRDRLSLVITTGTGSGKTESFLLPILAKLAIESQRSSAFATPAVRAILLYPMNALVNDQLGRLRLLFGNERVAVVPSQRGADGPRGLRATPAAPSIPACGRRRRTQRRLNSIETFYIALLEQAADPHSAQHEHAKRLFGEPLQSRGKWPSKPDLQRWYGKKGQRWQREGEFVRAVLRPEDAELLTRHEVLAQSPRHAGDELLDARVHADEATGAADLRCHPRMARRQSTGTSAAGCR